LPLVCFTPHSDEINRPENAYLKPAADKVKGAKAAVDAALPAGSGPISYADLLVLAAKVATQAAWKEVKVGVKGGGHGGVVSCV
jgi:L-ascorbate peroxidase